MSVPGPYELGASVTSASHDLWRVQWLPSEVLPAVLLISKMCMLEVPSVVLRLLSYTTLGVWR